MAVGSLALAMPLQEIIGHLPALLSQTQWTQQPMRDSGPRAQRPVLRARALAPRMQRFAVCMQGNATHLHVQGLLAHAALL